MVVNIIYIILYNKIILCVNTCVYREVKKKKKEKGFDLYHNYN
jgi:hypothetical protein